MGLEMEGAQMNKIDTGIAELLAKQPSDGAEKDAYIAELQKTVYVNEYLSHFAEKWLKCILAFTSLYLLEFRSLLLYNLIKECRRKVARIWQILIGEPCLQK